MDGSLYDGESFLTTGQYSLASEDHRVTGSIAVGKVTNLLNRGHLTLQQENGQRLNIVPRRVQHSAGQLAILMFDVEP
jgi:hypothetical protein